VAVEIGEHWSQPKDSRAGSGRSLSFPALSLEPGGAPSPPRVFEPGDLNSSAGMGCGLTVTADAPSHLTLIS